jgi:threonine/homoserine/homoserine lactone efflux protein
MLMITFLKGIALGIVIALPVGPVGVLCVRRTLFEGLTIGLASGLGAAVADTIFGIIAGFGLTVLRDWMLAYQDWFGAGGGAFLLFLGARALTADKGEPEPLADEARFGAFASAFALTITNPITILAFAACFAFAGVTAGAPNLSIVLLVSGVFVGSALWWLGLGLGVTGLKRRTGHVGLGWLNLTSGAILSLSGVGLLATSLWRLAAR